MSAGRLGDWLLGEELGRGGMGAVFAATHVRLPIEAAVKVHRAGGRPSLEAESHALAALDHPAVIRLLDVGRTADGAPWLVMERAVGAAPAATGWRQARHHLWMVLSGLAAAHGVGVLHLDVKPSNVLLRADGSFALADFGSSRSGGTGGEGGTPDYLAPERFDPEPSAWTEAADLYAVGCLAFHHLYGAPPWPGLGWAEAARAHRTAAVPRPPERLAAPRGLRAWIERLLAKDPAARFASAFDAAAALPDDPGGLPVSADDQPTTAAIAPTEPARPVTAPPIAPTPAPPPPAPAPLPPSPPDERRPRDHTRTGAGLLGLAAVPFTGRGPELAALWAALRRAEAGEAVLAAIVGPTGSGRRRLAARVQELAIRCGAARRPGGRQVAVVLAPPEGPLPARAARTLTVTWSHAPPPGVDVVVELAPFEPAELRAALSSWIGLTPSAVGDVAERVGADLGAAVELVRAWVRDGHLIAGQTGVAPARPTAPLPAPPELLDGWAARLPTDRGVELAAILGDSDLATLAALVGGREAAEATADTLVGAGLVHRRGDHLRWASELGRTAAVRRAGAEAAELHRRCAGVAGRFERGRHRLLAGDQEGYVDLLDDIADRMAQGRVAEAHEALLQVERLFRRGAVPEDGLAWARLWRAYGLLGPGRLGFALASEYNLRSLQVAGERTTLEWVRVRINATGGLLFLANLRRDPAEGAQWLRAGAALAELLGGAPSHEERAGWHFLAGGRPLEAEAAFERGGALGRARGVRQSVAIAPVSAAVARRHLGDPSAAERLAAAGAAALDAGYESIRSDWLAHLGDAHRDRGAHDRARECYAEALAAAAGGAAREDPGLNVGLALVLRAMGDEAGALRELAVAEALGLEPVWTALVTLHRATLRGAPTEDPTRALRTLTAAGHVDPDVRDSARRLLALRPDLDGALRDLVTWAP